MKKFLLLGTVLATSIITSLAQGYGTQVGATYYDLPSNISGFNRIAHNDDDGSVSTTWMQSTTPAAQPVTFDRGFGYNHLRPAAGAAWLYGTTGDCQNNNGCSQPGLNNYSGWPEMINFPSKTETIGDGSTVTTTKEMVFAHSGGLKHSMRWDRGDGFWNGAPTKINADVGACAADGEGVWPRAVTTGDYIHMIALNYDGPDSESDCAPYSDVVWPFLYYRSSDQGQNMDIVNFVLPGMENNDLFTQGRGDEYQIAANGNVVAITAGGGEEPWMMWKSTDAGLTWNFTVIRPWVPQVYEYVIDASTYGKETGDGSHAVVVDDNGDVHCFVGVQVLAIDATDFTYNNSWYPNLSSGIWYWNDKGTMCEPHKIADLVDYYDASGTKLTTPLHSNDAGYEPMDYMAPDVANYFASSTSMPSASTKADGSIYVVYTSYVEGTSTVTGNPLDPAAIPFRDNYLVWSNDDGKTWSHEINIAGKIAGADDGSFGTGIEEDIFPCVAHKIGTDNTLHMLWNLDYKPGSDVRDDANTDFSEQLEVYYGIDVTTLVMDAKETVAGTTSNSVSSSVTDTAMITMDTLELVIDENAAVMVDPLYPVYSYSLDTCEECGTFAKLDTLLNCGGTCATSADTSIYSGSSYQIFVLYYDTAGPGRDSIFVVDSMFNDTIVVLDSTNMNMGADSLFLISSDSGDIYTVSYMFGNACEDIEQTFLLSTLGAPNSADIRDTLVSICPGDSVDLSVIAGGPTGAFTYAWDNGAGTSATAKVSPTATTVYHVTVTDGGSATDSITVMVNSLPTATGEAGTDGSIDNSTDPCAALGQAPIGGGSDATGMSYSWSPLSGIDLDESITTENVVVDPTETTTYTLTITDDATGCMATDDVVVTVTAATYPCGTNVNEDVSFEYNVYPNPTTDLLTVDVNGAKMKVVTFYNNLGAIVEKVELKNVTQYTLNTTDYTSGTYYVFIETDAGSITKKFTVVE